MRELPNHLELDDKLTQIFLDVFDLDAITLRDDMTAQEVEEWDSLNHVKLVVAIESGLDQPMQEQHRVQRR